LPFNFNGREPITVTKPGGYKRGIGYLSTASIYKQPLAERSQARPDGAQCAVFLLKIGNLY